MGGPRGAKEGRELFMASYERLRALQSLISCQEMTPEVQSVTDHSATEDQDIGGQKQRAPQALFPARRMVANDRSAPTQKGTSAGITL